MISIAELSTSPTFLREHSSPNSTSKGDCRLALPATLARETPLAPGASVSPEQRPSLASKLGLALILARKCVYLLAQQCRSEKKTLFVAMVTRGMLF